MNALSLILFAVGFCILVCKRTTVDLICGVQICFMGLLSFIAVNGEKSLGIGFIILVCAGLFGAVGVSVLYKNGFDTSGGEE